MHPTTLQDKPIGCCRSSIEISSWRTSFSVSPHMPLTATPVPLPCQPRQTVYVFMMLTVLVMLIMCLLPQGVHPQKALRKLSYLILGCTRSSASLGRIALPQTHQCRSPSPMKVTSQLSCIVLRAAGTAVLHLSLLPVVVVPENAVKPEHGTLLDDCLRSLQALQT